jgi:hypothetical protein
MRQQETVELAETVSVHLPCPMLESGDKAALALGQAQQMVLLA